MRDFLKKLLKEYDRVFLITDGFVQSGDDWKRFCAVLQSFKNDKTREKLFFFIEKGVDYPLGYPYALLSHEDTRKIRDLYMTYEFSDQFLFLSDGKQYGSIFRYVDTGILTEEEAVNAMLR